ncbi:MAG: aspartate--tRNA ligase [Planctomycetes bacterium]|jgi:aspartyl-tRNA synthetase|nr:aspartate--tRNA ligase [Phycisphaerae bacterium]NBB95384.1 aspartate--tRNA ligase [Planctomycetota bacterium]
METFSDEALKRTHHCGQLRSSDIDAEVRLAGWVRSYRDHGGVVFIDLRDREGITQVVFDPDVGGEEMHTLARAIRNEWVIAVKGKVRPRGEDRVNPKLDTGEIEVICDELNVLNRAQPVPFEPDEYHSTSEENRLKYRYIDLRRTEMTRALRLRHQICRVMRAALDEDGFVEVETPFLTKSTPEGARDFLVPSRMQDAAFYALPQSPQLFKQVLMVGGLDRYYQIVRCFRDEDLRADRQPEFTQLDIEMSFATEADVMDVTNRIMRSVCELSGKSFPDEVPVMSFAEAVRRFGSDRPDLRFGMELIDVSDIVKETDFGVFTGAIDAGGVVKCIVVPGGAEMTRKETDGLAEWARGFGAGGMAVTKVAEGGALETGIAKFMAPVAAGLIERTGARAGDLLCFGSDKTTIVNRVLGELRCKLARERGMIDPGAMEWLWVVDFPLVEWNEDENRWDSLHHPFTAPKVEDMDKLDSDPGSVRSRAYDIVCNGLEMGGGSIRIHNLDVQEQVFRLLGISHEEARAKFSFLLDALSYGAPPHGGIAFGLDRTAMMMIGAGSIRDVIAFPKTQRGVCPLTGAPSDVDHMQLTELNLRIMDEPHNQ